jgi:low affinity Fe/Cu permease
MIGTNRDLVQMQQILDREIFRLNRLAGGPRGPGGIETRLARMCRQRISICAALVNRRIEAANKVVEFSRWVSGNGALGGPLGEPERAKAVADMARRGGGGRET